MEELEFFFSYSEESEIAANYESLESVSSILECLEGATIKTRRQGVCALYKKYFEAFLSAKEIFDSSLKQTSKCLVDQGGFSLLLHHFSFLSGRLRAERDFFLEQELRMLLNILFATLICVPLEDLQSELLQNSAMIEEAFVTLIKLSTECSYVPLKKVCMLFNCYLRIVLDRPKKHAFEPGQIILTYQVQMTMVESFYVRLIQKRAIGKENFLSQIVVGLLRGLLACCPGPVAAGVDIKQEWQSPSLLHSQHPDYFETFSSTPYSDEARHRYLTGFYISKVIQIMLKRFRLNHFLQCEYLSQLINDANGILVLLKFLNLEYPEICKVSALGRHEEVNRELIVHKCLRTMLFICYKINKGHADRIQANLVQFKSSLIFKKLLTKFPNSILEVPCLKVMRIQVKYLTKKWKSYPSNMRIISEIYQKLPPCKEDWINDRSSDRLSPEDRKKEIYNFNFSNYWQAIQEIPDDSPSIPQDFSEKYEEWLEENVWGYSYLY